MPSRFFLTAIAVACVPPSLVFASVFGVDSRTQVCPSCTLKPTQTPFSTMGKIIATFPDGKSFTGSGTMISPFHMLTAAHVVYSAENGGFATQVEFQPQRYGSQATYRSYSTRLRVPQTYVQNNQNNVGDFINSIDDYALVNLDRSIGRTTGWMDVQSYESYLQSYPIPPGALPVLNVAGYPFDRPNPGSATVPKGSALYIASGKVDAVTSNFLRFAPRDDCTTLFGVFSCQGVDWAKGQSGGAIWVNDVRDPDRHLLGVISSSSSDGSNTGLKISNGILASLASSMKASVTPGRGIIGGQVTTDEPSSLPDFSDYDSLYETMTATLQATSFNANDTLQLSMKVANSGTAASAANLVGFYLSPDAIISTSDFQLGMSAVGALAPFASTTVNFSAAMPNLLQGQYYLGWIIDPLNMQSEYFEDDNIGKYANLITINPSPGDFNGDGTVDAADYVVWRKGLGTTYTQPDYDVWRTHFGQTAGSGFGASANVAVPEPTTLLLLVIATTGAFLRQGRTA